MMWTNITSSSTGTYTTSGLGYTSPPAAERVVLPEDDNASFPFQDFLNLPRRANEKHEENCYLDRIGVDYKEYEPDTVI